ncbi:MAG: group III truncated hemoglobin [Deltaproteobacteria bacterium]|nr:group III truncated hemoglobin [Deltaproteobacteria bacterium]
MNDIETRDDVRTLVHAFYETTRRDPLLGGLFERRLAGRWEEHMERMTQFWMTVLFAVPLYAGRPLERHQGLPLGKEHFAQWLELWDAQITARYAGERADAARRAARRMATRMLHARGDLSAVDRRSAR